MVGNNSKVYDTSQAQLKEEKVKKQIWTAELYL